MVRCDDAKSVTEFENDIAVIERPRRIAVDADHRRAVTLVDCIHQNAAADRVPSSIERIEPSVDGHHSSPSIMQFRPLPIPRRPTESP